MVSEHNFSHRIHHFSFGDSAAGRIHPLDGDERITENSKYIAPTIVTNGSYVTYNLSTCQ